MSTFQTILFAADFSERSRGPYRIACALARRGGGTLIVAHVVVPVLFAEPSGPPGTASLPVFFPSDSPGHRAELSHQLQEFYPACAPLEVDYRVVHGDADKQLVALTHETKADLLVMGTHGRTGLDRLLAGSVAESVLRHADCPVLAFRAGPGEPERVDDNVGLILHPTDFSDDSHASFQVAHSLARDLGSRLLLLHVAANHHAGADERAQESLDALEAQARGDGADAAAAVEGRVVEGHPAPAILKTAGEVGAGLIVMGCHGRTGVQRLIMGSVAEAVLRSAGCPTLVVKQRRPEQSATP